MILNVTSHGYQVSNPSIIVGKEHRKETVTKVFACSLLFVNFFTLNILIKPISFQLISGNMVTYHILPSIILLLLMLLIVTIVTNKKTSSNEITAALYARVSTTEQDPLNQLTPLREYAERHGWKIIEYIDQISGKKSSRPGLDALRNTVSKREVDVVITTKIDRLSRSTLDFLTLLEEFEVHDVRFIAIDQSIDTSTPGGKLLRTVVASVAEFELDIIRERIKAGIAEKKRRGIYTGGRPTISKQTEKSILEAFQNNPNAPLRELTKIIPSYRTRTDRERCISYVTVWRVLKKHRLWPRREKKGRECVTKTDDLETIKKEVNS